VKTVLDLDGFHCLPPYVAAWRRRTRPRFLPDQNGLERTPATDRSRSRWFRSPVAIRPNIAPRNGACGDNGSPITDAVMLSSGNVPTCRNSQSSRRPICPGGGWQLAAARMVRSHDSASPLRVMACASQARLRPCPHILMPRRVVPKPLSPAQQAPSPPPPCRAGNVFHTYSTFVRGVEVMMAPMQCSILLQKVATRRRGWSGCTGPINTHPPR
jgi:hypothetical protein